MDHPPSDLWTDMSKLNSLYEELCWGNEDILEFVPDYENNRIIIRNKTMDGYIFPRSLNDW
mgnify:FL=1